jgi:hypothetical protein
VAARDLARKAAEERRRARRAIEPGRLEAREAEDPTRGIESVELSAGVQRALAELPPLYRDVLELHLLAGKTPQEIALALGRAPGTVRVQLHRGLDLLRRALRRGSRSAARWPRSATRGLAAVRAGVVQAGRTASVSIAAGVPAAPAAVLIGGIGMNAKVWILGATALAGVAWLGIGIRGRTPDPEPVEARAADTATLEPVDGPGGARTGPDLSPGGASANRVPVAASPRAPAPVETSVSGRLVRPDGTPASGAFVALLRMIDGRPREETRAAHHRGGRHVPAAGVPVRPWSWDWPIGFLPWGPVSLVDGGRAHRTRDPGSGLAHPRQAAAPRTPAPKGAGCGRLSRSFTSSFILDDVRLAWSEDRSSHTRTASRPTPTASSRSRGSSRGSTPWK